MAIKDLEARQGDVDLVAEVTEIAEPREFQKFGKTGRVANATIKDDTGEIKLTLWNEQIDQIKVGDKVHIKKGFVNEWQGEKQLTTGKFGTLEVVDSGSATAAPETDSPATEEATVPEETPTTEETPTEEPKKVVEEESNVEEEEVK